MKKTSTIGIDLAKNVFQVHGATVDGKQTFTRKLKREQLADFIAKQPVCLIGIEACSGAHYWARVFKQLGHQIKIIHPSYVKGYVQVTKNDMRDAAAIAEAASRQHAPTVAHKSIEQLDLQAIHRVRERLVKSRTALTNEIRGLLAEQGVVIPKGQAALRDKLQDILEDGVLDISFTLRTLIHDLREECSDLTARIQRYDQQLQAIAKKSEPCKRLMSIPGIGPIIATLLLAHAGDGSAYRTSRHLAASLGLVPAQHSSGGKERLLGISKRGDKHLRKQLVHGARAAYRSLIEKSDESRLGLWVRKQAESGKHVNMIVVAIANKLTRIAWSCLVNERHYQAM